MTAIEARAVYGFRSPEVCRRAGCTYRQLDYWVRSGLIYPSVMDANGSGTQRLWSASDVRVLRAFVALTRVAVLASSRSCSRPVWREMAADVERHVRGHGLTGSVVLADGLLTMNLVMVEDPFGGEGEDDAA